MNKNSNEHIVVLLRHAHSQWNAENRFSGWADIDLSEQGVLEARAAGALLARHGFHFDQAYTSVQQRAIRTLEIVLAEMKLIDVVTDRSWRLNERHYGALQGMNKQDIASQYGAEELAKLRRGYRTRPPALTLEDTRHPRHDARYADVDADLLPCAESLEDTEIRLRIYWDNVIWPQVRAGKRVLVVSHGNALRALAKHLERLSDDEVEKLEIPTGRPIVYVFGDDPKPLRRYYVEDETSVALKP